MKYDRIDPAQLKRMKKEILALDRKNLSLDEWLKIAAQIDPLISVAIEGIYCGEEGTAHEQLGNTRYWITYGWHRASTVTRIEYCYIS